MRVLLINPKGIAFGINLGIHYLAASLKKQGHEVLGLDLANRQVGGDLEEYTRKRVLEFKPNLIGISLLSFGCKSGMELIDDIRRYYWCPIVIGGAEAFIDQEKYLKKNKNIDFVLLGEAEETIVELAQELENGISKGDFLKIDGLIYRDQKTGEIHKIGGQKRVKNIDALPLPDYDCFEIEKLFTYPILTSRGCPFSCSYCFIPLMVGRTIRMRKISDVIDEIRLAKEKYEAKLIRIMDDCFSMSPKRVIEFCKAYKEAQIDLPWEVAPGFRADGITEEVLIALKDAKMNNLVKLGIESFVPHVFKLVNKGETLEQIENAIKLCKKHGFRTQGFFIIGLPEDTKDGVLYTKKKAEELGLDIVGFQMLMPFPRTVAYDWVQKNATILVDHREQCSSLHPGFTTPKFTAKEKLNLNRKLELEEARKGTPYPFDGRRGNLYNICLLSYLILRYDPKYTLKHLRRLIPRFFSSLKRGRAEEFMGIKFREVT